MGVSCGECEVAFATRAIVMRATRWLAHLPTVLTEVLLAVPVCWVLVLYVFEVVSPRHATAGRQLTRADQLTISLVSTLLGETSWRAAVNCKIASATANTIYVVRRCLQSYFESIAVSLSKEIRFIVLCLPMIGISHDDISHSSSKLVCTGCVI